MSNSTAGKYCTACGKPIIETAVVCSNCGSPTGNFVPRSAQGAPSLIISPEMNPGAKSKTTAVLLAVFLGFWSYLYTFKADAKLFWISIVAPPAFVLLFLLLWGGQVRAVFLLMLLFVSATFAIVAIIRQATRPESWFVEYTNAKSH
jgi:hypothetical protein